VYSFPLVIFIGSDGLRVGEKREDVNENGEKGLGFFPSRYAGFPMVSIPIPGEVMAGALKFGNKPLDYSKVC
jgi:hypothetical protein